MVPVMVARLVWLNAAEADRRSAARSETRIRINSPFRNRSTQADGRHNSGCGTFTRLTETLCFPEKVTVHTVLSQFGKTVNQWELIQRIKKNDCDALGAGARSEEHTSELQSRFD